MYGEGIHHLVYLNFSIFFLQIEKLQIQKKKSGSYEELIVLDFYIGQQIDLHQEIPHG
jgi:hypothetical protein